MADDLSIEITGVESFEKQLSKLHVAIRKKIMQQALTEAGLVLARAQIDSAPVRTDGVPGGNALPPGALKGDIIVEVDLHDGINIQAVKVGPTPDTAYVGRFLEFGHDIVSHGKKRNRRKIGKGHVDAHPWMQPAFDESANDALQKFQDVMIQGINEGANTGSSGEVLDDFNGS